LKDAQAIYGSAAANGVILLPRKWEKNSKAKISYKYIGFQETSRTLPMLATEYALLLNESYANGGNAIPFQMFLT
jgi:hypothetical protein